MAVRSRCATLAGALLCGLVAFATACGDSGGGASAAAADIRYETLDGKSASLAAFKGKPVVVNWFASWCTPCRLEMPDFEQVHAKLGDRVHFIGLNLQEGVNNANEVVAATKVTYTIGLDRDGAVYRGYNGFTMPTTVFLDANGAAVKLHAGSLDAGALTNMIADQLGVK